MKQIINHPHKKRKPKATSNRVPFLGALLALNNNLKNLKLLASGGNQNADSIVEILKLLLIAEMIAKIIKALL